MENQLTRKYGFKKENLYGRTKGGVDQGGMKRVKVNNKQNDTDLIVISISNGIWLDTYTLHFTKYHNSKSRLVILTTQL